MKAGIKAVGELLDIQLERVRLLSKREANGGNVPNMGAEIEHALLLATVADCGFGDIYLSSIQSKDFDARFENFGRPPRTPEELVQYTLHASKKFMDSGELDATSREAMTMVRDLSDALLNGEDDEEG